MFYRRLSFLAVSLFWTIAPALAAEPVASDEVVAESRLHFQRGVKLYEEGSLDAALAEFTRAYELTHDYRLLYNLAQVQAERHNYVRAIKYFKDYQRESGETLSKERRAEVEDELARLHLRVGELWISANVQGGEVWIGDHLACRLPQKEPILLNAGPNVVRLTSPGYKPAIRELDVAGGDRPRLKIQLERAAAAPTTVVVQERVIDRTWLWVSLTATGALAAGSVVFGALANNANKTLDDRLNTYPTDADSIDDARRTVRTHALVTDVLAGVALMGAGASLYFYLRPTYENPTPPPKKGATARIVPSPTGLWLDGTF